MADRLVVDLAERLFRDHEDAPGLRPAAPLSEALWAAFLDSGLAMLLNDRAEPGVAEAVAVARCAGYRAVRAPIVEALLGSWADRLSGVDNGDTLTIVLVKFAPGATCLPNDGRHHADICLRVPWARWAGSLLVLPAPQQQNDANPAVVRALHAQLAGAEVIAGCNLADEPRDEVRFAADAAKLIELESSLRDRTIALGALLTAARMAGAATRVLELANEHSVARVQFGRPIAAFQAVQQMLAQLAAQVAAVGAAVDFATGAMAAAQSDALLLAAIAKARASEAAGLITELAHQITGAIGFTREHALHRHTRILWAARDEWGSERFWHHYLGRSALQADGKLWRFATTLGG